MHLRTANSDELAADVVDSNSRRDSAGGQRSHVLAELVQNNRSVNNKEIISPSAITFVLGKNSLFLKVL